MIYSLDKKFEVVRTIVSNKTNDVMVAKAKTNNDPQFYTLVQIKDKSCQARLLKIISQNHMGNFISDFVEIMAFESSVILIFKYITESKLFYYKSLYWRNFSDRLKVAKNLLAELMSSRMPVEILYFMLDENNLNLTADGSVFFNYFLNFDILPETVNMQDIINRAAEVVLRILTEDIKIKYFETDLLRVKVLRKSFSSFADIYSDLKNIPDKEETGSYLFKKLKRWNKRYKARVLSITKAVILAVIIGASLFYTFTQWDSRKAVPVQATETAVYDGLNKIGTITLQPDEASNTK